MFLTNFFEPPTKALRHHPKQVEQRLELHVGSGCSSSRTLLGAAEARISSAMGCINGTASPPCLSLSPSLFPLPLPSITAITSSLLHMDINRAVTVAVVICCLDRDINALQAVAIQ